MLKNYKDLKVLKKVYWVGKKRHPRKRKNAKDADKVFRKQTLESLTPGILGPSSPTKLEKNLIFLLGTNFITNQALTPID